MPKKHDTFHKLKSHPDFDEIVSKLLIGITPIDIHEWLNAKYSAANESKFLLSEKTLKNFQENYLDVYQTIKQDFQVAKHAIATNSTDAMELSIKDSLTYKQVVMDTVSQELDLKKAIQNLCQVVELRLGQIFDSIQEDPRNINTRIDRVFIEYVDKLGSLLEKAYKIVNNGPDQVVQHNFTVQHIDQNVGVFYEAIKQTLELMDVESSMFFIEKFREILSKLKDPATLPMQPVNERMAEVKVLHETINQQLNGPTQ